MKNTSDLYLAQRESARATISVLHELQKIPSFGEEEVFALKVLAELLDESLRILDGVSLSDAQLAHITQAGEKLLSASDNLKHDPSPSDVLNWIPGIDAAIRGFMRAVVDLKRR